VEELAMKRILVVGLVFLFTVLGAALVGAEKSADARPRTAPDGVPRLTDWCCCVRVVRTVKVWRGTY